MKIDPEALKEAHKAWRAIRDKGPEPFSDSIDFGLECLGAAIEAYLTARPDPNPWREIEEAPRDGTWILKSRNDGIPAVVQWLDRQGGCWFDKHGMGYIEKSNHMFRQIGPVPS